MFAVVEDSISQLLIKWKLFLNSSEQLEKYNDKYNEQDHGYPEQIEILWPKYKAKDDKFTFKDIQH